MNVKKAVLSKLREKVEPLLLPRGEGCVHPPGEGPAEKREGITQEKHPPKNSVVGRPRQKKGKIKYGTEPSNKPKGSRPMTRGVKPKISNLGSKEKVPNQEGPQPLPKYLMLTANKKKREKK